MDEHVADHEPDRLNMEYNAGQIAEEAIRAMGITDMDRFRVDPKQLQQNGQAHHSK